MEQFVIEHWISIASLLLQCGIVKVVWSKYKEYCVKAEARDVALRSLLRSQIIATCHKAEKEGYLEIFNVENLNEMYRTYKALDGNGGIETIVEAALDLPHYAVKKDETRCCDK